MRLDGLALSLLPVGSFGRELPVRVDWGGNRLNGHGMRADLKNDTLQLASKVHGVLLH